MVQEPERRVVDVGVARGDLRAATKTGKIVANVAVVLLDREGQVLAGEELLRRNQPVKGNCSPRDGAGAEGLTSGTVTGSAPAAPYPRPNRAATRASAASTVKASGSKSSPSISSHSWRRGCAGSPRTASSSW